MGEWDINPEKESRFGIWKFNEEWGDHDPDAILEAMRLARETADQSLPFEDLTDKLGERFLIVPGETEIGRNQTIALVHGYLTNQEGWDALIDGSNTIDKQ